MAPYIKHTKWDLTIIDEAHRLRNVYKPTNKISNTIKSALSQSRKILLTATPLQNSILELYGLVSIIDDYVFGDLKSFKSQFCRNLEEADYNELRNRLLPVCKRTLRRQVLEYIKYTRRIAIVEEFFPTDNEQKLYDMVTEYLSRTKLYALPNSQRQLMTMILRKLLASSTYAIYDTFCSLISRLERKIQSQDTIIDTLELDDYETNDEEWIDDEEVEEEATAILHPQDIKNIQNEISDLNSFRELAAKIKKNSKAEHLITALKKGFSQLDEQKANRKALIFTESKRTQEFLYELLENRGYKGKVVRFNGSNTDKQSTAIYNAWFEKYKGTPKSTGSVTADRRAAIVDYFKEEATIMIATEAASEGINLQFCSLVVNYDMPWNPQRIEQRIGRCHRYGQKYDVVVINFLNKANAADVRVYELLDQKFQLFNGVFGASDEVLGSIGNGVDFEKRIAQIYDKCRTTEEIEAAFDALQDELKSQISDNMLKARSTILENFDESVQEKLKMNLAMSLTNLNTFEKRLWTLTEYALNGTALFDEDNKSFLLEGTREFDGLYYISQEDFIRKKALPEYAQPYRIGHPLAQSILARYKSAESDVEEVTYQYEPTLGKVALIQELVGQSGWLRVDKVSIDSFEPEDHLVVSAFTDNGEEIYSEIAEKLLLLKAQTHTPAIADSTSFEKLETLFYKQRQSIIDDTSLRNQNYFEEEMDKLDCWASDMKVSLEREITDLDAEIKLRKSEAKKMIQLKDKVAAQRNIKDLEKKRADKRQSLYEAQDDIDNKKEKLLSKVESMLEQRVEQNELFAIRWNLI